MFNEEYIECFEDVELNFNCIINGYKNITCGDMVAYHYESISRNNNIDKNKHLIIDYNKKLLPFVIVNFNKLKKTINII
jgi:GT2 family glycosyltransferase